MCKYYTYIIKCIFLILLTTSCAVMQEQTVTQAVVKPRVIITTDICNDKTDSNDKQSLGHLLLYANQVEIIAMIPDDCSEKGLLNINECLTAYSLDFNNIENNFQTLGFPSPSYLQNRLIDDKDEAIKVIITEARKQNDVPLYVLAWGNMRIIKDALFAAPDIASKIRLLTVGTRIKSPFEDRCGNLNWNGWGRTEVFSDHRFKKLWWIENDWANLGLLIGNEPIEIINKIKGYGALGIYLEKVNALKPGFKIADSATLLYLLDPTVSKDHPEYGGWAGNFIKPYPVERPNYWVDRANTKKWNYKNPCDTWEIAEQAYNERTNAVKERRKVMYTQLTVRMKKLYNLSLNN
ncbi:DUF1593 domain-containing protein [Flammeovirga pectinis]|uniref:DUF1593 domain-containing protein n=1 Tax=Flammeovirga pectinis TaxID=2494373 RepID=A0A3S9P6W9_9BACT|nr:nucleoside hydrolase-like domain-containing protein [Flammeovirga pectinis]AZQ63969.1 DUF1593 domain-containing protein [Flammeovirga pectinis]